VAGTLARIAIEASIKVFHIAKGIHEREKSKVIIRKIIDD